MAKEAKQRRIHRLAPCPAYDVEKIESWLTDMAKEGWILENDGCFFGFLTFLKDIPSCIHYRLEPKKDGTGFGDTPDVEIRELCEEYGWEYVDSYGAFFIYRSTRPDAREMNTDLQVQAAALKAGQKNSTVTLVLDFILLGNIFSHFTQMPYWSLVHMGLTYHLAHLIALVWIGADSLLHWHHMRRLRKQLKAGIPLDHSKSWKRGAAFHLFSKIAYVLVIFLLFGVIFGSCTRSMDLDYMDTTQYPGAPPFVTAADIVPGSVFTSQRFLQGYNAYTVNRSYFASEIIEWKEYGDLRTPEGGIYDGSLIITYYDTRWPWLAEGLMEDLYRNAEDNSHFVSLPTPELDVDEVLCYNNVYPTILIRQGNILVEASVALQSGDHYLLEEWAQQMAQMLIQE